MIIQTPIARARVLYQKVNEFYDGFDCGMAMADTMNPTGYRLRKEFSDIWRHLQSQDAACPPGPSWMLPADG